LVGVGGPCQPDKLGCLVAKLTICVEQHGSDVLVEVRDDGVGVDPDAVGTLFARFSHGQSHTSTAGRERYGIGLALVREIALAHGGDVGVAQTPGGGATFRLHVPAAPPA
jgi:signal transduction histidine kinase